MKNSLHDLLFGVFGICYDDADFLCKEADSFDVDFCDLDFPEMNSPECKDSMTNEIMYQIYSLAIQNAGIDEEKHEISIFTNCLDSHLHIDGDEIYDKDDLKKFSK